MYTLRRQMAQAVRVHFPKETSTWTALVDHARLDLSVCSGYTAGEARSDLRRATIAPKPSTKATRVARSPRARSTSATPANGGNQRSPTPSKIPSRPNTTRNVTPTRTLGESQNSPLTASLTVPIPANDNKSSTGASTDKPEKTTSKLRVAETIPAIEANSLSLSVTQEPAV